MSRKLWIFFVLTLIVVWCSGSAVKKTTFVSNSDKKLKILGVFAHLGKSHFDVFVPLLEELARRGHEMTVISYFPRSEERKAKEPLPNYKDISLYSPEKGVYLGVVDLHHVGGTRWLFKNELMKLRMMALHACEDALSNERLRKFIREEKTEYDLILTESFNTDCFLGFVHRFKVPFIAMSSHQILPWAATALGEPYELSYLPGTLFGLSSGLSFWERVSNFLSVPYVMFVYNYFFHPMSQSIAEAAFGPGLPDLREISKNSSALLLNTHFSLHGSRPHQPNVIDIGGLHIPPTTKPLPDDIAKFLDDAREGVLYFNLGSMIKAASMPKEKLDVILRVIGSMPRKVIWKWETDLPDKPKNIMIKKWLPQFDILNHPNVKCYLGHGGLLGLSEGIYVGKPMILIPMYGDQFHNAAAAKARDVAIVLNFETLNEEDLRHAINEMFNNTSYQENAKKVSKAYRDRPASPLETAVWWTEYVARGNGLPYIRNEAVKLSWYQRELLDVILFLFCATLIAIYLIYRSIKRILKLFSRPAPMKDTKNGFKKSWKKD